MVAVYIESVRAGRPERLVLRNASGAGVNLRDYSLNARSNTGTDNVSFPPSASVGSGESITFSTNRGPNALSGRDLWNDAGAKIQLRGPSNQLLSQWVYGDKLATNSMPTLVSNPPDEMKFGEVEIGKSKSLTLTLSNPTQRSTPSDRGQRDVHLGNSGSTSATPFLEITGTDSANFRLDPAPESFAVLPETGSISFSVIFEPTSATPAQKSATINITNNTTVNPKTIILSGTAKDVPKPEITSDLKQTGDDYDFGEVVVDNASKNRSEKTFWIENKGTVPLELTTTSPTVSDTSQQNYTISTYKDTNIKKDELRCGKVAFLSEI